MNRKGTKTRNNQREFYVPTLEGKKYNPTVGTFASPTVQPLQDAYAGSADVETQDYSHK